MSIRLLDSRGSRTIPSRGFEEYIEAHHLVPLSFYAEDEIPELSPRDDFAVVCANCHRMLHRGDAPEDFKEFVRLFGGYRRKPTR